MSKYIVRFAVDPSEVKPKPEMTVDEQRVFLGLAKNALGGYSKIRELICKRMVVVGWSIDLDTEEDVDRVLLSLAHKGVFWLEDASPSFVDLVDRFQRRERDKGN